MSNLFGNMGFYTNTILNLTPKEAYEICKQGAIIIDVREEYMNRFKQFDVEQVIYCPQSILEEHYNELPTDKPLIFADATGLHSKEGVLFLIDKQFTNIANLAGGIVEWEHDDLPLVIDKTERLSGSCMCQLRPREKNKK